MDRLRGASKAHGAIWRAARPRYKDIGLEAMYRNARDTVLQHAVYTESRGLQLLSSGIMPAVLYSFAAWERKSRRKSCDSDRAFRQVLSHTVVDTLKHETTILSGRILSRWALLQLPVSTTK